ncbi:MAG: DUF362 domain-containing protein [Bacteroidales bacterium]
MKTFNRRDFIKVSVAGSLATYSYPFLTDAQLFQQNQQKQYARVSIATGTSRAEIVFKALEPFSGEIKQAIGNKRVVLKPNNVLIYVPLACTHVETLEGILEFLKSIKKLNNVVITESSASGSTLEGFDNYGYFRLLSKYPVKFIDLDDEPYENMYVIDERDFRPHLMRISKIITDPASFVVSVARMKTHNSVVATLSLKNIVVGAPVKDKGFTLYNEDIRFSEKAIPSKPGTVSYKRLIHGSGVHATNFNMAMLAQKLHPHLAVIDGFTGMEGNGPTLGTPVEHRVCIASTDWLAADRIAVELMGIDFSTIGYLNYCAQMGLGTADIKSIEIVGENIKDHIIKYKLPDNIERIILWMKPKV